jgi:hypothetical protein
MILRSVLRVLGAVTLLMTVYYILPLSHARVIAAVLPIGLALLTILIIFQARQIISSPYQAVYAIEAIAINVPPVLLRFACAHEAMSSISASSFGPPLTHTAALHFTITVFSTAGFGDTTAKTDANSVTASSPCLAAPTLLRLMRRPTRRDGAPTGTVRRTFVAGSIRWGRFRSVTSVRDAAARRFQRV